MGVELNFAGGKLLMMWSDDRGKWDAFCLVWGSIGHLVHTGFRA